MLETGSRNIILLRYDQEYEYDLGVPASRSWLVSHPFLSLGQKLVDPINLHLVWLYGFQCSTRSRPLTKP